jgi:hypothetical protein
VELLLLNNGTELLLPGSLLPELDVSALPPSELELWIGQVSLKMPPPGQS